jgi:hypothetical protein
MIYMKSQVWFLSLKIVSKPIATQNWKLELVIVEVPVMWVVYWNAMKSISWNL